MMTYFIFAGKTRTSYKIARDKEGQPITVTAAEKKLACEIAASKLPNLWVQVKPLRMLK